MEKLELKHLAPYLPYGLKMGYGGYDLVLNVDNHPNNCCDLEYSIKKQIKPILKPLSDLTDKEKYELDNIITEGYIDDFINLVVETSSSCEGGYNSYDIWDSYLLIQKLLEWHFDVFGLIPKGLAIDINTL